MLIILNISEESLSHCTFMSICWSCFCLIAVSAAIVYVASLSDHCSQFNEVLKCSPLHHYLPCHRNYFIGCTQIRAISLVGFHIDHFLAPLTASMCVSVYLYFLNFCIIISPWHVSKRQWLIYMHHWREWYVL